MLDYGFATLDDLKLRLGITDTQNDSILQSILDLTAGMIESTAGRTLRRDHARVEIFPGGSAVLRVGVSPIAKVHSIRESATGNFVDSDSYVELIEGTDFVLDGADSGGTGQRAGESGLIRSLKGKWLMGSGGQPTIQVRYTGGYKTDEEAALENRTLTLTGQDRFRLYELVKSGENLPVVNAYFSQKDETDPSDAQNWSFRTDINYRAIIRIDVRDILLPVWYFDPYALQIELAAWSPSEDSSYWGILLSHDPAIRSPNLLWEDIEAASPNIGFIVNPLYAAGATPETTFHRSHRVISDAQVAFVQSSIRDGYIAMATRPYAIGHRLYFISQICNIPSLRPELFVQHRPQFHDPFTVPDDLRNANLLQAIYEFQTRGTPGMISQAMRGVAVASGASYLKTLTDLLPEVQRVAMRYRRLY